METLCDGPVRQVNVQFGNFGYGFTFKNDLNIKSSTNAFLISNVLPGSSAFNKNLNSGDKIIKVNGKDTHKFSYAELSDYINLYATTKKDLLLMIVSKKNVSKANNWSELNWSLNDSLTSLRLTEQVDTTAPLAVLESSTSSSNASSLHQTAVSTSGPPNQLTGSFQKPQTDSQTASFYLRPEVPSNSTNSIFFTAEDGSGVGGAASSTVENGTVSSRSSGNISSSIGASAAAVSKSDSTCSLVGGGPKLSYVVRALFSYNAAEDGALPNKGLEFQMGDILLLVNASDSDWWQARKIHPRSGHSLSTVGLVPSRARLQRRRRIRSRKVNFSLNRALAGSPSGGDLHLAGRSQLGDVDSGLSQSRKFMMDASGGAGTGGLYTSNKRSSSFNANQSFSSAISRRVGAALSSTTSSTTLNGTSLDGENPKPANGRLAGEVAPSSVGGSGIFRRLRMRRMLGGTGATSLSSKGSMRSQAGPKSSSSHHSVSALNGLDSRGRSLDSVLSGSSREEIGGGVELFYQQVVQKKFPICRPVALFGPLCEKVAFKLASDYPNDFSFPKLLIAQSQADTTTTPGQIPDEFNNPDFLVISNFQRSYKALSYTAIKEVAANQRHALLLIPEAPGEIRTWTQLSSSVAPPISILLDYRGPLHLRSVLLSSCAVDSVWSQAAPPANLTLAAPAAGGGSGSLEGPAVDSYATLWEFSLRLRAEENMRFYTAAICCDNLDDFYQEVRVIIDDHSGSKAWVPV